MTAHGLEAKQQLIEHNLRLVVSVAKRYSSQGISFEDLVQWGNEGLIISLDKYDPDKARFTTHATYGIMRTIRIGIAKAGLPGTIPVGILHELFKYRTHKREARKQGQSRTIFNKVLEDSGMKDADFYEQVEIFLRPSNFGLGLGGGQPDKDFYRRVMAVGAIEQSIDKGATDDERFEDYTWEDLIDGVKHDLPEEVVLSRLNNENLKEVLPRLSARRRVIIEHMFGFTGDPPKTLMEIATELGCSRDNIRQAVSRSLDILRNELTTRRSTVDIPKVNTSYNEKKLDTRVRRDSVFHDWPADDIAILLSRQLKSSGNYTKVIKMLNTVRGRSQLSFAEGLFKRYSRQPVDSKTRDYWRDRLLELRQDEWGMDDLRSASELFAAAKGIIPEGNKKVAASTKSILRDMLLAEDIAPSASVHLLRHRIKTFNH